MNPLLRHATHHRTELPFHFLVITATVWAKNQLSIRYSPWFLIINQKQDPLEQETQ